MLGAVTDQIPSSLLNEGWLMLSSLVSDCLSREFHVHVALDPRFDNEVGKLRTNTRLVIHTATPSTDRIPDAWFEISQQSDALLLIAPESDGVLQHAIERLSASANLVNCHNGFLNAACDKLLTAEKLTAANVATPATFLRVTQHLIGCMNSASMMTNGFSNREMALDAMLSRYSAAANSKCACEMGRCIPQPRYFSRFTSVSLTVVQPSSTAQGKPIGCHCAHSVSLHRHDRST